MFDYGAFLLFLLYLALLACGAFQLKMTLQNSRNKRLTIRNGIVSLLTLSMLLRVVFWLKLCLPGDLPDGIGLVLFFLPLWSIFCALSLLVVFYAVAVSPVPSTKAPMTVCVGVNACLLLANLVIAGALNSHTISSTARANLAVAYACYGSLLDFSLAICLGYFGYQFKSASTRRVLTTRIVAHSLLIFESVNYVLVVTSLFRGTFSAILASNTVLPAGEGDVNFKASHGVTSPLICLFFVICEITPVACVLGMMWRVSQPSRLGKRGFDTGSHHDATLDSRLLSVADDAKVRVFIAADVDISLADAGGDAAADLLPTPYLFFHDELPAEEDDETQDAQRTTYSPPPPPLPCQSHPRPIPTSSSITSPSATASKTPPSFFQWSFFHTHRQSTPPITIHSNSHSNSHSREPTPDIFNMHNELDDFSSASSSSAANEASSEAYAETLSPRDILLQTERRRNSGKGHQPLPHHRK